MNLDILKSVSPGPLPKANKFITGLANKSKKSFFGMGKPKVKSTTVKMDLEYPSCVYPADMDEAVAVTIFKKFAKIEKKEKMKASEFISGYPKNKDKQEIFRILNEKSVIRLCFITSDKKYMRTYWVVEDYAMVGFYDVTKWKTYDDYALVRLG